MKMNQNYINGIVDFCPKCQGIMMKLSDLEKCDDIKYMIIMCLACGYNYPDRSW